MRLDLGRISLLLQFTSYYYPKNCYFSVHLGKQTDRVIGGSLYSRYSNIRAKSQFKIR